MSKTVYYSFEDLEKLQLDISEYENDEKNIFGHGIEEWWQSF